MEHETFVTGVTGGVFLFGKSVGVWVSLSLALPGPFLLGVRGTAKLHKDGGMLESGDGGRTKERSIKLTNED